MSAVKSIHPLAKRISSGRHLAAVLGEHLVSNLLAELYTQPRPSRIGTALEARAVTLRQKFQLSRDGTCGRGQIWEGIEIHSGAPLRVTYFALRRAFSGRSPEYLQHILFQPGTLQTSSLGEQDISRIRQILEKFKESADLFIVENYPPLRHHPDSGYSVTAPVWTRMAIDFHPGETSEQLHQRLRHQKWNIHLVHRLGWQLKITKSPSEFTHFYHNLYLPLARERHGSYAAVDSHAGMLKYLKRGILLVLQDQQGRMNAGMLALVKNSTLFGISAGVLNGDQDLLSRGALSALYYHTILWCHQNGFSRYDVGECRPFTTDGIYRHKLRWGMRPVPNLWSEREWTFWVPDGNPTALEWLAAHPIIQV